MTMHKRAARVLGVASGAAAAGCGVAALAAGAGAWALWRRLSSAPEGAFEGKVVVITGGSRGLGLALAEEFGRHGARLVLGARDPYELERARDLLLERGAIANQDAALIVPCDIREEAQAQELVARATHRFSRVDVLVNNAGIITVGPVEHQPFANFDDAMRTNFYGMLHCTLAVLPQMVASGSGAIVNICSIGGKLAVPHLLPYSASKFAAVGFSEGLHAELRSRGIRVTTVCPGLMRTGSHLRAYFTGQREEEYRWFSLGAGLPFVSMPAARAAREIVRAAADGRAEIILTPQAQIAARMMGLFPSFTQTLLHLSNLALPGPGQGDSAQLEEGRKVRGRELSGLTVLGSRAAHHYNEHS
jgi:short-subunit dehydrogenase